KIVVLAAGIKERRQHIGGQSLLAVTASIEEVQLATAPAHQHVGAGNVSAAREVEAYKGNLAGAVKANAAGINHALLDGQCRGSSRQAEDRSVQHRCHTGVKALGDKFAAGAGAAVIPVAQGLIQTKKRSALSHG